jgi:DNA-directed RNA polymerase subunit RPC12/RpoP
VIKLACATCKTDLEVDDALAGRKSKCPHCQTINDVPYPDFYSFACPSCGKELDVSADSLGKMVKCPHCGVSTFTPSRQGATTSTGCFTSLVAVALIIGATFLSLVLGP